MNIAINARLLLKNKMEGIGWFTFETMKHITLNHPEHKFYFIFDRPFDAQFIFSDNVYPIVIRPKARHPILFYYWFEKSIPKILNKINADIFISTDGFLSLKSQIKSVAVIHDINFMHHPEWFPFLVRKYYRYFFPKYAQKANRIVTVSEFSKQDIVKQFKINSHLIDVVYNGSNTIYKPLTGEKQIETKRNYSNGKDFFLFVGALSPRKNVANLISAFDVFKSNTKSNLKLIVVGEKLFKTKDIKSSYRKLRYKKDLIFTGHLQPKELTKLYSASLALTYVSYFEGFGIPLIEAMNCETAIICSNLTAMPEIAGNTALQADPFSVNSIANAMIKVYRDKDLRNKMVEKGKLQRQKFSWDQTAEKFWQSIKKVLDE